MGRPLLLLAISPVYIIGALIARASGFAWDTRLFSWGFAILVPAVIAAHYANEYADFQTDALTVRTPFSGGSGVLAEKAGLRRLALGSSWVFLLIGVSLALAGYLGGSVTPNALLLWAVGTFGGIAYSLPPFKLAWRGWSEAVNAFLIGILLPLYGYSVQTGRLDWRVFAGCVPFALLIFVLILSTNWPDREADRAVGKRTLSVRLPADRLRRYYGIAAFLGFALQFALIDRILPREVVWSSLPSVPVLLWAGRRYTRILSPQPTVIALILLLPLQLGAWILAGRSL